MLYHNTIDISAAPATKKRGARAQNADRISSAKSPDDPDDSRPDPFGKPPAWAEVMITLALLNNVKADVFTGTSSSVRDF